MDSQSQLLSINMAGIDQNPIALDGGVIFPT